MPDAKLSLFKSGLIFVGAGSGGLLRYWIGGLIQNWWGPTFPIGTLVVNLTGCLAMGFLATAWMGPILIREEFRSAILVGIIGGYTTFSSFGFETITLARQGECWRAGVYVIASVAISLLAVWAGGAIAIKLFGANGS